MGGGGGGSRLGLRTEGFLGVNKGFGEFQVHDTGFRPYQP